MKLNGAAARAFPAPEPQPLVIEMASINGYAVDDNGNVGVRGRDATGAPLAVVFPLDVADMLIAAINRAESEAAARGGATSQDGATPVVVPSTFQVLPTGKTHALDGVLLTFNVGAPDALTYGLPLPALGRFGAELREAERAQWAARKRLIVPN